MLQMKLYKKRLIYLIVESILYLALLGVSSALKVALFPFRYQIILLGVFAIFYSPLLYYGKTNLNINSIPSTINKNYLGNIVIGLFLLYSIGYGFILWDYETPSPYTIFFIYLTCGVPLFVKQGLRIHNLKITHRKQVEKEGTSTPTSPTI